MVNSIVLWGIEIGPKLGRLSMGGSIPVSVIRTKPIPKRRIPDRAEAAPRDPFKEASDFERFVRKCANRLDGRPHKILKEFPDARREAWEKLLRPSVKPRAFV